MSKSLQASFEVVFILNPDSFQAWQSRQFSLLIIIFKIEIFQLDFVLCVFYSLMFYLSYFSNKNLGVYLR